jgi:ferritin-like protein
MSYPILKYFSYRHLPMHLQDASRPFCELAMKVALTEDNAEIEECLRKLLEAKDCAVRAALS